jgi:hypothetical protein
MNAPVIASVERPPERHADRIVGEMLRYIAREHVNAITQVKTTVREMMPGNPKAQARMVERLKRIVGINLIDIKLEPGKRGRYVIELYDWAAYDDNRGDEIRPEDRLPEKPWLVCTVVRIEGHGRNSFTSDGRYCLYVCHHALSRLVQRSGVRTIGDLIAATRVLWRAYRDHRQTMPPRVRTPDGFKITAGNVIAVLRRHAHGGMVVTTILSRD